MRASYENVANFAIWAAISALMPGSNMVANTVLAVSANEFLWHNILNKARIEWKCVVMTLFVVAILVHLV